MLMIKTDGMCFPLWALNDPAIPETFADNIQRLEDALHVAGYNIRVLYSSSMDRCYWAMDYTPLNVWITSCSSNVGQKIVDEGTISTGGGRTIMTIGSKTYRVDGGGSGAQGQNLSKPAGGGGRQYQAPSGSTVHFVPGAPGQSGGGIGGGSNVDFSWGYALCGGGAGGSNGTSSGAALGGGGSGAFMTSSSENIAAQNGGDGYILIEYAG